LSDPAESTVDENPYRSPECEPESASVTQVNEGAVLGGVRFWIGYLFAQFLVVNLLAPNDGGHWLSIMLPLLGVYNLLLFGFLFAIRKHLQPSDRTAGKAWGISLSVFLSPAAVVILATLVLDMF
jgi:hypothetical protein